MKRTLLIVPAILSLSGCVAIHDTLGPGWAERQDRNPDTKFVLAETAWQTLNVLDGMQTIHLANSPECYSEVGFPSQAIMGSHPDKRSVVLTTLAYAVGYRFVSSWLEHKEHGQVEEEARDGWRSVRAGWHTLSLITKGFVVARNASRGLRPLSSAGCTR